MLSSMSERQQCPPKTNIRFRNKMKRNGKNENDFVDTQSQTYSVYTLLRISVETVATA